MNPIPGQPTIPIPSSVFLSAHPSKPNLVSIGAHLRTAYNTGKQFNTPYMPWPEAEIELRKWFSNRERFLARWFDWTPAKVARQMAGKRLPAANPHAGLSLADLGL